MIIGLDFDNTITCYDRAIARLAGEVFDLPAHVKKTKVGLRDYLRAENREPEWTAFQGQLYGPGMDYAEAFPGAIKAIVALKQAGHRCVIISHRTKHPHLGPQYDLHTSVRKWIAAHLRHEGTAIFAETDITMNETRDKKIAVISATQCDVFLDDLLEVLDDTHFPASTKKLWFTDRPAPPNSNISVIQHWDELWQHCTP
jgi:hypothetical protein